MVRKKKKKKKKKNSTSQVFGSSYSKHSMQIQSQPVPVIHLAFAHNRATGEFNPSTHVCNNDGIVIPTPATTKAHKFGSRPIKNQDWGQNQRDKRGSIDLRTSLVDRDIALTRTKSFCRYIHSFLLDTQHIMASQERRSLLNDSLMVQLALIHLERVFW